MTTVDRDAPPLSLEEPVDTTLPKRRPVFGDAYGLRQLADRLQRGDELDDHLRRILLLHLRDAAERLDRKDNAQRNARQKADRSIAHHVGGLQAAAIDAAFDPTGFYVYCLWGDDDQVLYVGQSTNVLGRLGTHLGDSRKRGHIRRVTLEARLIGDHQPPWNIVGIRR